MRDIGVYGRWSDFVAVSAFPLIVLLIYGATTDGPLLSSTALVSYPLAIALCAGGFGVAPTALLSRACRAASADLFAVTGVATCSPGRVLLVAELSLGNDHRRRMWASRVDRRRNAP